jgi:hypothetical protein
MPHLRNCSKELREDKQPRRLRRFLGDRKRSLGRRRYTQFLKLARYLKSKGKRAAPRNGAPSGTQPWQLY